MSKLFIHIYHYFSSHKGLFYASLVTCVAVMAWFALQVRFEENVNSFLPDTRSADKAREVFDNLRIKDKIIVMFAAADTTALPDYEALVESGNRLEQALTARLDSTYIHDILFRVDDGLIAETTGFVYNYLPLFADDADYHRFDSLLNDSAVAAAMQRNYANLISPAGMALRPFIMRDPLSLGANTLKHLQDFRLKSNYEQIDDHIFSKDGRTAFMFISPAFAAGSTGHNQHLIEELENTITQQNNDHPQIRISYFGGPAVAVYNARQIKADTMITTAIALVIIVFFISMVFKRKRAIPLIVAPALFGALFALCLIFFIKGTISAIAVGAGSVVFGIALSYSIHLLAHQNHVGSVEQLIKEIAYPLTVGSFTTIGAFAGLLFTSSGLLRDFGLFASLVLVGTTLFCLIYLPHFLKGQADVKQGRVLRLIERVNGYAFDRNKWLIAIVLTLTIVCLFTARWVGFNSNMMDLNYEPHHLKQAEEALGNTFNSTEKTVLFVTVGENMNEASSHYSETNHLLSAMKSQGLIKDYATAQQFVVAPEEQQRRLQRWNDYWTPEKKNYLRQAIDKEASRYKFRQQAFDPFFEWLDSPFKTLDYRDSKGLAGNKLLTEWQTTTDSLTMLISQVRLADQDKEAVYEAFNNESVVVFDRAYFTNKWVSAVNDDFYLILFISSFLVFFALWISYGRIELALLSFMPMCVSWVIITGLMGMLGIQFNIVNIILATFIFGIGDDFSIFIMDGLLSKYRTGQRLLNSHKTAIFFSAFTMIVGMGALIFAKHPALQSIPVISIAGMVVVVLVSYTLQPLFFRLFIAGPASKGLPPYTLRGILRSALMFLCFGIGCLVAGSIILLLTLVPIRKAAKKRFVCHLIHHSCRGIIALATFARKIKINPTNERFDRPAIIIANHQSFIDILVLLALSPKIVMITKRWVWHSPWFGFIIRYIDFYHAGEGYEQSFSLLRRKMDEGYSIAIFPEGTRTPNGRMKRFHKGAFYLSEALQADIIPILLHGNHRISPKAQPFNLRKSAMICQILPRISPTDAAWGSTYQERTKRISAYMKEEYRRLCLTDAPDNPYYYETLVQNYIYKGPVEEWYIRIKVKMEGNYRLFDELVPRRARITDIGCGFGPLAYMLAMLSDERQVLGIDYDEDKIAVANHCWLRDERVNFACADALAYPLPPSDVFILSDVLHYMSYERQTALLAKCASLLATGGVIIVRDGNASDARHGLTRLTELWSTRIMRFNKTREELCFTSTERMQAFADGHGLTLRSIRNDRYTSNTIYLLSRCPSL